MSYAPHSNDAVHAQMLSGVVPTELPMVMGAFVEKDYGNFFEYAERRWPDDSIHPELPHVIFVHDAISGTATRLAKVLGTVAYVLTDGDTVEKWTIKQHKIYPTEWIGRA